MGAVLSSQNDAINVIAIQVELFVFFSPVYNHCVTHGIGMGIQCGPVEGLSDGYTAGVFVYITLE